MSPRVRLLFLGFVVATGCTHYHSMATPMPDKVLFIRDTSYIVFTKQHLQRCNVVAGGLVGCQTQPIPDAD